MQTRDHVDKAKVLQASLAKLDHVDDCELWAELIMHVCTHLLNARLHALGETPAHSDQIHTQFPERSYSSRLFPPALIRQLWTLEEARACAVRGNLIGPAELEEYRALPDMFWSATKAVL